MQPQAARISSKLLCKMMNVSRSGYYKWKNREKSTRDFRREEVIAMVERSNNKHSSHGYRWVAAYIRSNEHAKFSDHYVDKAFRYLGIQSKTQHKVHYRFRKVKDKYPNLILTTWDTVDRHAKSSFPI